MDIVSLFKEYNIDLNEKQIEQFNKYYEFLVSENQKYNLTAITEYDDVLIKHFLDSVLPYKEFKDNTKILDVGAGAGFPSVPLAILRPDIQFTLIDSVNKKVNFLIQLKTILNLSNINPIHTRCEDFAKLNREKYDYVVARAVAPMNVLCEYLIPFAKVNGQVFMYKGDNFEYEIKQCENVLKMFHVKHFDTLKYQIKYNNETINRNIIILNKLNVTNPKYPRGGNKPRLNPLT